MPPKNKFARGRIMPSRQTSQQSTLSFHGKQNTVTKPGIAQPTKSTKKDATLREDITHTDVKAEAEADLEEASVAEAATEQQVEQEAETLTDPLQDGDVKAEDVAGGRARVSGSTLGAVGGKASGWVGDEEQQARKVTDTKIKHYWRAKENERLAPRVHQEDLSVFEKVLREFDMSGQYGPCIGITRLKRWKRANLLGLKPPIEVLAVIVKEMDAGNAKSQRAYIDELMSSRFIET